MLKLYYNAVSPYAQRVLFFVQEAKIPHTPVPLDFRAGDFQKEPFTKLSPFNTVPAIELGGFAMNESQAILRYLAQKYQKSSWYPENLEERGTIDQVMDVGAQHVGRWLLTMAWQLAMAPRMGMPTNTLKVNEARDELMKWLPRFEKHIAGRTWAAGPQMTIADASFAPFLPLYKAGQMSLSDFPGTKAYADRLAALPTYQKLVAGAEDFLAKR